MAYPPMDRSIWRPPSPAAGGAGPPVAAALARLSERLRRPVSPAELARMTRHISCRGYSSRRIREAVGDPAPPRALLEAVARVLAFVEATGRAPDRIPAGPDRLPAVLWEG